MGAFESTGGRKAKAMALVSESRHALGIALAENHFEMVGVNLAGEVVAYARHHENFARRTAYFRMLGDLCGDFCVQNNIPESSVLGVGFAIPGIVEQNGAHISDSYILKIKSCPSDQFSRFIPYPCLFLNGANAACFAEFSGKTVANAVYLSLSYTIGGGVFIGREIFHGDHQRGGELGHMLVEPGGRQCYCGKRGCLDTYCAAKVLEDESGYTLPAFFDLLAAGDSSCAEVWDRYTTYLAAAVHNIRMLFDCEIVVGGYVGEFMDRHMRPLRDKTAQLNTFEQDGSYVRACRFRRGAAASGAALIHIDNFISGM